MNGKKNHKMSLMWHTQHTHTHSHTYNMQGGKVFIQHGITKTELLYYAKKKQNEIQNRVNCET